MPTGLSSRSSLKRIAQAGAIMLAAIAAGAQGTIDSSGHARIRGELDADSQSQVDIDGSPGTALRGSEDTGLYRSVPLVARPYDEIARRESGAYIEETGDWRHTGNGQMIATGHAGAAITLADGLRVTADVDDVEVNAHNVHHISSPFPIPRYVTNDVSGALGFSFDVTGADQFGAQALYGVNGFGGRATLDHEWHDGKLGMSAVYNEPYLVSAETVADHASRSGGEIDLAQHIAHGMWAHAQLNYTRYGVGSDENAARTLGFNGNVYYTTKAFGGIWGLRYDIDGEYVIGSHKYPLGAALFTPLEIRHREIHAGSGSVGMPIWDDFGFDLYGGYAYDRFTHGDQFGIQRRSQGPFFGGEFRFKAAPGVELSLGGHYSSVPNLPGEKGPETSAALNLIYRLDDGDGAPPGWSL